jgi:hypothetical protein
MLSIRESPVGDFEKIIGQSEAVKEQQGVPSPIGNPKSVERTK